MEKEVKSFSKKGYGVADGVEIAHTIPGDLIEFELTRKKRLPKKGRLLNVLSPSKDRVVPRCSHANICGGCCWQQMAYTAQLEEKQKRVEKAFHQKAEPIIPCHTPWRYRNKMEFTFSQNRADEKFLGLMIAQAEPYVFHLEECHLTSEWMAEALKSVRKWWHNSSIRAYNPPKDEGSLRYLTLREAVRSQEKMAILNVSGNPDYALNKSQIGGFTQAIKEVIGDNGSIFLRIHQTKKGKPTQFYEMHLHGPDHITEELKLKEASLFFKISPASFFQPNTLSAETLYNTALDLLGSPSTLYDLYCGTGTLGMAMSKRAKQVIAIELSSEAVLDAKENIQRNQISNMRVLQGDVGKVLSQQKEDPNFSPPDAVIVDPPRAGLDPLALDHLKNLLPKTILYISCNPSTQAENIQELIDAGYQLKTLQPVDQFPHTYHIENIALLQRPLASQNFA